MTISKCDKKLRTERQEHQSKLDAAHVLQKSTLAELDELKTKYKSDKIDTRRSNAEVLKEKDEVINNLNKKCDQEIYDMQGMMFELVDEMKNATKVARTAQRSESKISDTAANHFAKLKECQSALDQINLDVIKESKLRYQLTLENAELTTELERTKAEYEEAVHQLTPRRIERDWKHKGRWPNWVVQLAMEMLVTRTPPSCITSSIFSTVAAIHPDMYKEMVKDLPGEQRNV